METLSHRGVIKRYFLWDATTDTLKNTLTGHTNRVYSVAFSPNGNTIASASYDRTVRLWDAHTGNLRNTLIGHNDRVYSVAFSPNGNTIASASYDRTVRLWDAYTGNLRNTLEHTNRVNSVAFSPNGNTIASASWSKVFLWNATTDTLKNTLTGHNNRVYSVAFSPDGNTIASGCYQEVFLWDVTTGTLKNTLTGHTHWVYSVAFSPDGNTIASGSEDGTVLLWQLTPTTAPLTFTPSTIANQTFEVGTLVYLTCPIATGGTPPYTYTLSPVPAGLAFDVATRNLYGTPTTVMKPMPVTYTVTDVSAQTATLTFTIEVTAGSLDVNGDGKVDVLDLVWVAVSYGMRGPGLPADVNSDGVVNVQDLIAVAAGVDAAAALPLKVVEEVLLAAEGAAAEIDGIAGAPVSGFGNPRQPILSGDVAYGNVAAALADVRSFSGGDVRLGKWLPVLERFLLQEMSTIPETTALLPNYPNPFNPETWIPYHLATDAAVKLTIYDVRGERVRAFVLGHQPAGIYERRGRAAYWDGRNALGEPVSSGLYFYTLTAGDFTATRRLLIAK